VRDLGVRQPTRALASLRGRDVAARDATSSGPRRRRSGARRRIALDPEKLEQGLAQLVLTIVELIRQLLERQALRRVEAGSLSEAQVERLGKAFLALAAKMTELKKLFHLRDEDLNIDLGPLGTVV
jgi:hypothetical protein